MAIRLGVGRGMTEQEKCETCKEVCRLDGYPEESRARYCKVKDKYINSDDNQCYIGKTYINVVIAARQQEPKHDYAVLFRSYKQGNGMGGLYGDPSEPDYIVAIYALGKKYVPATMTGKVKFVYDSDSDETSPERLSEHDAAIREDERNRVITAFIEKGYTRIETVAPLEGIHLGWVLLSDVKSCLESLRATTRAPCNRQEPEKERDYQCGDECHGECSGEYDGRIHCPVSEAEQRIADVIAELEKRSKQVETIGDNGRIVLAYQEAISLLKNGVKQ